MGDSFWHNFRNFRGHMRGKSLRDVAKMKAVARLGPFAIPIGVINEIAMTRGVGVVSGSRELRAAHDADTPAERAVKAMREGE